MLKKLIVATVIIYLGHGIVSNVMAYEKPCTSWECRVVYCPDKYALWIPEHQAFLPCESFDEYVETRNVDLLR